MQHAPLHHCGACRHAFHVHGCPMKWLTLNSRPAVIKVLEGLSSIVQNIAFFLCRNSAIFSRARIMPRGIKMIHLRTTLDEEIQMLGNQIWNVWKSSHIHHLNSRSIFLCSLINEMDVGKFFIGVTTCYSKSERRLTIQTSKMFLSTELNSTLNHPIFQHPYSYTKSA